MTEPVRLRVWDTLTGRLIPIPITEDEHGRRLRLYVCGVTPYDSGHMGHAFTFMSFDILVRYLEAIGVRVRYVQNVTDVDDPLFERARRDGVGWKQLAETEQTRFGEDMDELGWRRPDAMPRVSEEIDDILRAVAELADAGHAYQADSLYFDTSRYPAFGALSKRTRRSMTGKLRAEGLLGEVGEGRKRDLLDFPLWRSSRPDEPAWDSSFGPGRPGWHIECSAMARRHLGEQIDIHGGGRDLVYSHHESERAQSESLTGCAPFSRGWMHTGMVRFEGRKMSKSLGNLVVAREALARVSPAAVRLYLALHHYRRDWTFRWEGLERAERLVTRLSALLGGMCGDPLAPAAEGPLVDGFRAALDDDLDTRAAVNMLSTAARAGDAESARWMLGILAGHASLESPPRR